MIVVVVMVVVNLHVHVVFAFAQSLNKQDTTISYRQSITETKQKRRLCTCWIVLGEQIYGRNDLSQKLPKQSAIYTYEDSAFNIPHFINAQ